MPPRDAGSHQIRNALVWIGCNLLQQKAIVLENIANRRRFKQPLIIFKVGAHAVTPFDDGQLYLEWISHAYGWDRRDNQALYLARLQKCRLIQKVELKKRISAVYRAHFQFIQENLERKARMIQRIHRYLADMCENLAQSRLSGQAHTKRDRS